MEFGIVHPVCHREQAGRREAESPAHRAAPQLVVSFDVELAAEIPTCATSLDRDANGFLLTPQATCDTLTTTLGGLNAACGLPQTVECTAVDLGGAEIVAELGARAATGTPAREGEVPVGVAAPASSTGSYSVQAGVSTGFGSQGTAQALGVGNCQSYSLRVVDLFAQAMVAELDALKGLAMKVGQVLSYMDIGLPDETTAALARLQTGTRPMEPAEIASIIQASLGMPLDVAFEEFAPSPVAAASIGQVHRARVGGHPVAVKVRYPHIRDALAHDLANVRPIGKMVSLATAIDGPAIVEELRLRLLEECDYRLEAAWQVEAATAFADDPELHVPAVVHTHCAEAVLTTRWADGDPFRTLCDAPAARRDAASRTLARFPWTCLLRHGFLHTDPHPGNFVFPGDGDVVVLDWGSARRFDATDLAPFRALLRAILDGDRARFRTALVGAGLVPRAETFDFDVAWAMHAWLFAPYLTPHFQFSRAWWHGGRLLIRAHKLNQRQQAMPPAWIWLYRVSAGVHAVLARLGGGGDYRSILRDAL